MHRSEHKDSSNFNDFLKSTKLDPSKSLTISKEDLKPKNYRETVPAKNT